MNDLFTDIPEGRRSPPAGALESGSPNAVAREPNPGGAVPGGAEIESSTEQAAGSSTTVKSAERAATRTPPAPELDEPLPEVITEAQWARILNGRKVRWLVKAEQQEWAGKRAVSCGACQHTKMHGDPRRGWCTEHRFLVSMAFPILCREFTTT